MSVTEPRRILPFGALLALAALVGTGLMALAKWHSQPYIAENERQYLLSNLATVVPTELYDNIPSEDWLAINSGDWLGGTGPAIVYRARKEGRPAAVVFTVVAPDGYTGPIRMLVGIDVSGTITGVRVLSHKETPGLGDSIEVERSDWILGFDGQSRRTLADSRWKVRRDGGEFDQFTGATITPRAVVKAVHKSLQYFDAHRSEIFPELTSE